MASNGIFEIFTRVYIINMQEHETRWAQVLQELKKVGINDFHRFEGIKVNNGETMRDREIGCMLSHQAIIRECKEKNIERVLILEDDVEFSEKTIEFLEKEDVKGFIKEVPFDLFYLGCNFNGRNNRVVNDFVVQVEYGFSTHCYCVSRQAYDYILNMNEKLGLAYDILLTQIQAHFQSYCIMPRIAFQRKGMSYIQNKECDYDRVLK